MSPIVALVWEVEAGEAVINAKLGDYKGALLDFDKTIELDPNYALAYDSRGNVKLLLGQKDSGCLDFSKAGEMGYMKAYDTIREYCQ